MHDHVTILEGVRGWRGRNVGSQQKGLGVRVHISLSFCPFVLILSGLLF